jgi:hypothetical protein
VENGSVSFSNHGPQRFLLLTRKLICFLKTQEKPVEMWIAFRITVNIRNDILPLNDPYENIRVLE